MATYIKTLKQYDDIIIPRTKTVAITNSDNVALDVILSNKVEKTYVDGELAKKQNVIDAEHKLDYSLIANHPNIPSKTSELENDSGFLTEAAIEHKADKTALQAEVSSREQADLALQNGKQDKLTAGENITIDGSTIKAVDTKYTAGENVTITNNVISAIGGKVDDVKVNGQSVLEGKVANLDLTSYAKLIDLQIGKSFTTDVTVGHLDAGTVINSTDTLGDLIYRILYKKPVGDVIDLYFGANDNIPSSKDGLTKVSDQPIVTLLSSGINRNIVCGHGEGAEAVPQYPTFACSKDILLDTWVVAAFPYPMDFVTIDKGDYNIYYLPDASYDTPDGIDYHFTFKEGNKKLGGPR